MNQLHKKGIFTLLRFLNECNLSLVLILNREITDGEPGDSNKKDSYEKTVYALQPFRNGQISPDNQSQQQ